MPLRRPVVALLTVLVVGCSAGDQVADFGAEPPENSPGLPADSGLDVADAPEPDTVPPVDAELVDGGWPEVAAFVAREAEQGRPTVVNLFASWCEPCEREMPMLLDTARERTDIVFLGVDHQDGREDAERWVAELGVDIPTIYDPEGDVAYTVGARGMPTTVGFDAEGRLVARVVGELTERSLEELLAQVT